MHRLTLPYPPSVNHLYATIRGRRVLSVAGKEFKHAVFELFHAARGVLVEGLVWVALSVTPPDRRKRDLDNLLKITQDALTGLAWTDDSQIARLSIARTGVVLAPGQVVVDYGPC
jgi:crossover junction endodeoxyribonuclease RusA